MQIVEATRTFSAPPANPKLGNSIQIKEGTIGELGSLIPNTKQAWVQFARENTGAVWVATAVSDYRVVA